MAAGGVEVSVWSTEEGGGMYGLVLIDKLFDWLNIPPQPGAWVLAVSGAIEEVVGIGAVSELEAKSCVLCSWSVNTP
jgi:hypothetical protein